MALSAKSVRSQISKMMPLLKNCSLETIRKGQNTIGALMEAKHRRQVMVKEHPFARFSGAWIIPEDERRQGVILYIHGGGFTCGDLEYAKGFGSTLAYQCGVRVFCAGYRLAPENPFPAALEDVLEAYQYLLSKGYTPEHISLCGESAGGGLCYSLCLKLKELGQPLPGSIVAISPWTDMTLSSESYERNRKADPSMTVELLDYFRECYTEDCRNPLASPFFGDLTGMPPSLIFSGEDEIMLSDARNLAQKLTDSGCEAKLTVRPERWHAYLVYGLEEDQEDFDTLNAFLTRHLSAENKLRWMRLDNAAKIYPAARRQNWSNVFRLSVTLTEDVDKAILQSALDVTVRRFPSIAARLRRGVFWYYLEQVSRAPSIRKEASYPLTRMSGKEMRKCAFRVIAYKKRIAVEFFHSLTDGNGALIFLKSLTAEYLQQKYGVAIPAVNGVLGRLEEPSEEEVEDSFQKYAGPVPASRKGNDAWHLSGTLEPGGFLNLTCFQVPVRQVLDKAHEYGVSVTNFLGAAMMMALQNLQRETIPNPMRRKHIKVLLPVNLRNIFPSKSLRNFALYTTPEIDPRMGEYNFAEICDAIRHRMGLEVNPKFMGSLINTNVSSERIMAVKLMPLFIKNIVMKAVFDAVGERKSTLSLSNLGVVRLPEEMKPYVKRMDFILGVQATAPNNCGVLSYGDTIYINFIRNTKEPELEYHFSQVLRDMGLTVTVESNQKE